MTTLTIGAAPVTKTADQLRAERRARDAVVHRLVGHVLETAQFFVLALGFLLVLVAG